MATKSQLANAAMKSAKTIIGSRSAFAQTSLDHLMRSCMRLGFMLVIGATSIQAQTLASSEGTKENSLTVRKNTPNTLRRIELKCITGETYTLKTGETRPVYMSPSGKRYVETAKGGKYYPKKLNTDL